MGFPYPHYDAEFGCGVAGICALTAVIAPMARWLPQWAGALLMSVPLALLFVWCVWTWYRVRRGE